MSKYDNEHVILVDLIGSTIHWTTIANKNICEQRKIKKKIHFI